MKKEPNLITCNNCTDWDDKRRYFKSCHYCHNSKLVIAPTEILCNMCGETLCPIGTHNEQIPHGLYNASVTGGYESYHLMDMREYTFSFCEKCLRQMFIQCKIKPEISDIDYDNVARDKWAEDQSAYEYRVWTDDGGHHQAYLDKKCNAIKDCPNKAIYSKFHNDEFRENCMCEEHKNYYGSVGDKTFPFISNILKPFL